MAEQNFPEFLEDIRPYFYLRKICYVDVGAFEGKVFQMVVEAGLSIAEAHLIEPNPKSFEVLETNARAAFTGKGLRLHNLAIGEAESTLVMEDARTMTRVVATADAAFDARRDLSAQFSSACVSLDGLSATFSSRKISILKIDVEGFEEQVLKGASRLLGEERVDVVYIEVGASPEGTQQVYYRLIDDIMIGYGYRVFRIYEQMHEWLDDSPIMRRMNVAYFSTHFSESNPFKLSRQLMDARSRISALETELAARQAPRHATNEDAGQREAVEAENEKLRAQNEVLRASNDNLKTEMARLSAEGGQLTARLSEMRVECITRAEAARTEQQLALVSDAQLRAEIRGLRSRLTKAVAGRGKAERALTATLKSMSWKITAPLRWLVRLLPRKMRGPTKRGATKTNPPKTSAPTEPAYFREVEDQLWGGFSRYALTKLETAVGAPGATDRDRSSAGRILAGWYAAEGNFAQARQYAALAVLSQQSNGRLDAALVEAHCMSFLGQGEAARAVLRPHLDHPVAALAMANTFAPAAEAARDPASQDDKRLKWINRAFERSGLAAITKRDNSAPLSIDNIVCEPRSPVVDGPMISVVMPTYESAKTLGNAVRSLVEQTWLNIEIIIVDDHSSDNTIEIARDLSHNDVRIKIIEQIENRGTYIARNAGLAVAKGEFITVHDADDWSHPQKLALQAKQLIEHEELLGNHSNWSRVLFDMTFTGKIRHKSKLIDWNPSSFMFRRALADRLGGWDEVRISADAEFIRRAQKAFPGQKLGEVLRDVPLAFGLNSITSLTAKSATNGRTIYHGVRREYREAADFWLASAPPSGLKLKSGDRPFPVPGLLLPTPRNEIACDLLLIDDFSGRDGTRALDSVKSAIDGQRKIAAFHWPHANSPSRTALDGELRRLAQAGAVDIVAPGERVRAERVMVGDPSIAAHVIDLFPDVETEALEFAGEPSAEVMEVLRGLIHSSAPPRSVTKEADPQESHLI